MLKEMCNSFEEMLRLQEGQDVVNDVKVGKYTDKECSIDFLDQYGRSMSYVLSEGKDEDHIQLKIVAEGKTIKNTPVHVTDSVLTSEIETEKEGKKLPKEKDKIEKLKKWKSRRLELKKLKKHDRKTKKVS